MNNALPGGHSELLNFSWVRHTEPRRLDCGSDFSVYPLFGSKQDIEPKTLSERKMLGKILFNHIFIWWV